MEAQEWTSRTLWSHLQARDNQAWQEYLVRYRGRFWAVAKEVGLSPTEAEELRQEVGVQILLGKVRWVGQGRLGDFLAAVARNLAHLFRRRRPRETSLPPDILSHTNPDTRSAHANGGSDYSIAMLLFLLDQVALELPTQDIQAFELMKLQGYTAAETFQALFGSQEDTPTDTNPEQKYKKVYDAVGRVKKRIEQLAVKYRESGPPDEYLQRFRRQVAQSSSSAPSPPSRLSRKSGSADYQGRS